jgi:hypothetical protein
MEIKMHELDVRMNRNAAFNGSSAAKNDSSSPIKSNMDKKISRLIQEVRIHESLMKVMELLQPKLLESSHDEAMIALALAPSEFVNPLSKHEVAVLACSLYMEHLGRTVDYNDVLVLTQRFRGRAMNTTMVYNTFRDLQERGLLEEKGRILDERTERLSRSFAINSAGKEAFRLAIVNAHHLEQTQGRAAA